MPSLELRTNLLYGLGIMLICWLITFMVIQLCLMWANGRASRYDNLGALDNLRHTKEWVNSLRLPSLGVVLLLWCLAFAMTGWVFNGSSDDPVGTLVEEPAEPGQLYTGSNNPETRTDELRKEGVLLQKEEMEALDDFRTDFFDKRKEKATDEKTD